MNCKPSHFLAAITAVIVAATGAASVGTPAGAAPGEVSSRGLHLVASVDANDVFPAGGDIAPGVPFAHQVKVSGEFSASLDGASGVRSGEIIVGYLIGCAVDVSNGISVAVSPSVGTSYGISPTVALTLSMPPSVTVGITPSFSVNQSLSAGIAVNLAPGTVTAAVIGAAELDSDSTYPYTFSHTNTPLNVSACLSPASAMPFVTARADSTSGTVQTTGYGVAFGF